MPMARRQIPSDPIRGAMGKSRRNNAGGGKALYWQDSNYNAVFQHFMEFICKIIPIGGTPFPSVAALPTIGLCITLKTAGWGRHD